LVILKTGRPFHDRVIVPVAAGSATNSASAPDPRLVLFCPAMSAPIPSGNHPQAAPPTWVMTRPGLWLVYNFASTTPCRRDVDRDRRSAPDNRGEVFPLNGVNSNDPRSFQGLGGRHGVVVLVGGSLPAHAEAGVVRDSVSLLLLLLATRS
jgi:hypothetical protein